MRNTKTAQLLAEGPIDVNTWLHHIAGEQALNMPLIRQAAILAQLAGEEQATPNGESCLHQGLVMAEILFELHMDEEAIAAAILFPSVCYADFSLEDVGEQLGSKVAKLIEGTQRMNAIQALHQQYGRRNQLQPSMDNLRKMLLAMVDDIRVVLIKLAERLCVLRQVKMFNAQQRKQVAEETDLIYAPLANRLGIGHLKWQLEDLSFRYLQPAIYKDITHSIKESRVVREQFVKNFIAELQQILTAAHVNHVTITGRAKHIYGIYRKMQRKDVSIGEIYDALAVRILVDNVADCYAALGHINAHWEHIPKEFDDYIAQPKPNGYRSIHTAIIGPDNKHVEIQIRSYDMHQESELGVAAHWQYKEEGALKSDYGDKITWLRQVMDWQQGVSEQDQTGPTLSQVFADRVYVFTPAGDVVDLPKGATPLDFAYHIHSEIGHRCRGGKVNDVLVPLTYKLKTGEQVSILTTKSGHPSRDWLNPHLGYLKTSRAKAKVHHWFREQEYDRNVQQGQELIGKELRRLNFKMADLEKIAPRLNYKNTNDLLAGLGRGDVRSGSIVSALQQELEKKAPPPTAAPLPGAAPTARPSVGSGIIVRGVGQLLSHVANCCKPIPGDAIIGYVTINRGVSIHRKDCQNILRLLEGSKARLIEVSWGKKGKEKYPVDLVINAYDRQGLVRDITSLLANEHIALLGINSLTNRREHSAKINLTIEIDNLHPLSRILARLEQLSNVVSVQRVG